MLEITSQFYIMFCEWYVLVWYNTVMMLVWSVQRIHSICICFLTKGVLQNGAILRDPKTQIPELPPPQAIILTKAWVLYCCLGSYFFSFFYFFLFILFLLPNYIPVMPFYCNSFHIMTSEVLQQEYSQPPILTSPNFWWVVNVTP